MEKTAVQRLAKVLRLLVTAVFVLNLFTLLFVPGLAALLSQGGPDQVKWSILSALETYGAYEGMMRLSVVFVRSFGWIWGQLGAVLLALFYWGCGICTATILWQARRVLDTVLEGVPFQMANALNLKRAAICCWTISGGALVRLIIWLWAVQGPAPLLTYTALFIPAFTMAGLLFMVMSALFRQAVELKEDQDLTI